MEYLYKTVHQSYYLNAIQVIPENEMFMISLPILHLQVTIKYTLASWNSIKEVSRISVASSNNTPRSISIYIDITLLKTWITKCSWKQTSCSSDLGVVSSTDTNSTELTWYDHITKISKQSRPCKRVFWKIVCVNLLDGTRSSSPYLQNSCIIIY